MLKIISSVLLVLTCVSNAFAQLNIVPNVSPSVLVNTIIGTGVTVSNITVNGSPGSSRGTFTCGAGCNLSLPSGIILTSGGALIAGQPNTGTGQGVACGTGGDPNLDSLTTGPTMDACVLEFDFTAASDTLQFNYIFASEEYSDYVGVTFNDVFGFFVSGPGITGQQNVALVPGTSTPVTINNVNNGYSVPGVPPTGPCMNCAYYTDNTANVFTTAYDGFTTFMTVKVVTMPCGTYHIKLAIADVSDHYFDSGVFIEANSFSSLGETCLTANGQVLCHDTAYFCQGDSIVITAPPGPGLVWSTGDTTLSITVSQPGNYSCQYNSGLCFSFATITIIADSVIPVPVITQVADTLFSSVTSANYTYSWSLNGNLLPGANTPQLTISQYGCYVLTVSDTGTTCPPASDTLCIVNSGIYTTGLQNGVMLIPNPFSQHAILTFNNPGKENFILKISDATGRELRKMTQINSGSVNIDKENLKPGIYFYELKNKKGFFYKGKFLVE